MPCPPRISVNPATRMSTPMGTASLLPLATNDEGQVALHSIYIRLLRLPATQSILSVTVQAITGSAFSTAAVHAQYPKSSPKMPKGIQCDRFVCMLFVSSVRGAAVRRGGMRANGRLRDPSESEAPEVDIYVFSPRIPSSASHSHDVSYGHADCFENA